MPDEQELAHRFLKADLWREWRDPATETDQRRKLPPPPLQKPAPEGAARVSLVAPQDFRLGTMPLLEVLRRRRSHRKFTAAPLTLEELSFLLWATQGVHEVTLKGAATLRSVPSGGARHPFETYLWVNRVEGLAPGLYRYLALEHQLCVLSADDDLAARVVDACAGQAFAGSGAVTFMWAAIPYRSAWRYALVAPKLVAQDSGHVCQNLYLASAAIGAGTCAMGAYDQAKIDALLGLDGESEFVVYVAPVGKIA
jgi:SagB-type dehydrogenase family enzyme